MTAGSKSPRRRSPSTQRKDPPASSGTVEIPSADLPGSPRRHPMLGLGLWAMGRWTREDEPRTIATLERALDRGIRWFDTAEVYGNGRSERLLGDVLARRGADPDGLFLTTKVSVEHLRGPMARAALLGSLQRLGRRQVDLYLIHAPDPHVPIAETLRALEELRREGRIGALGVSNFSLEEIEEARRALPEAPLVVDQIRYNLFEREEADRLREYCRRQQILLEAYTPLARGLLAGRYLDGESPAGEVRSFARDLFDRDRFPELRDRAKALRSLAGSAGVPMASLALHGIARHGAAPLFGASRPDQVDEVLEAWARRPDPATLDRADALARGERA